MGSTKPLSFSFFAFIVSFSEIAHAQQNQPCEVLSMPAQSSYNFTEAISRWGSIESFDLDSTLYGVRSIEVNNLPIFDELNRKENNSLFRWINDIHIDTNKNVIANQLLFKVGDKVDSQLLAENERLLRQRKYVSDSKIRVLRKCDQLVDLEVVTREVWTLVPGFSFSSSGGDNNLSVGLREANILGTGHRASVFYASDADRDSYQLSYENPNIGGSYKSVKLQADSNSDGYHYLAEYSLPFYSMGSRSAWNIAYESTEEILTQYRFGSKLTEINHQNETVELSRGFSAGLSGGEVNRVSYGLRYESHDYSRGIDLPEPNQPPTAISLLYPYVEFEQVEDNFAVAYNISQIYRAEDLHLGRRLLTRFGYAPESPSRFIASGEFSDTLVSRPKMLMQWGTNWYGKWNSQTGSWEDAVINLNVDYHRGQTENRTLYMGLSAAHAFNLNNGEQITLGGSTGLRGFDSHYLHGDSSLRFSIEERIFSNYHIFQLFRLGFAGFLDVGRVFGEIEDGAGRTFSDVGLGIRLAPSKSDTGKIIHIDVAYPLQSNIPGGSSLQLVLEAKVTL